MSLPHRALRLAALIAVLSILSAPVSAQGFLCLEGGGSFGDGDWGDELAEWCVAKAGGELDVLLIGTFGSDNGLLGAFLDAGADSVQTLNPTGALANATSTFDAIMDADIVWVRDGLTSTMLTQWEGTLVQQALREFYLDGGVLGASGGGAMLMGEFIFDRANGSFAPRDALEDSFTPRLSLQQGFLEIAPALLVDEDFTGAGRLPRLALMVARTRNDFGAEALGVGLDDRAALGISPNGIADVLGEGSVTLLHALPQTAYVLESGQPPAITDMRYLQLVAGYSVDLTNQEVVERPPHAILQGPPLSSPIFSSFNVNGSVESHSNFGDVKLQYGLGFDSLVLGALSTVEADNLMFRTVVATNSWLAPETHEIKVGGVQYALSQHPHFLGLLLDNNVRVRATVDNTLIVREVLAGPVRSAMLLDSFGVTSTATSLGIHDVNQSTAPRQSVALDDARLHLLRPNDAFDAETHRPIMPDSQWLDVGQGLGGSTGVPKLSGHGSVIAFNLLEASLSNAAPFSSAFLVIGFSELGAPLKQGVLVPSPDIISNALAVDGTGSLAIDVLWPTAVPAGFDVYTQFWINDSAAPSGFAASNGLIILPP